MMFAYADPPYPRRAKRYYGKHPDYAGEVDHAELVARLVRDYPDGWALSTAADTLRDVLMLCPSDVRVAVWHITSAQPPGGKRDRWHLSWEPVIIHRGRSRSGVGPIVRDVLAAGALTGGCAKRSGKVITGQKPPPFCRWVFGLLGAQAGDELHDLFPGSGAVAKEWAAYASQPWLEDAPKPKSAHPERIGPRLERAGLMDPLL